MSGSFPTTARRMGDHFEGCFEGGTKGGNWEVTSGALFDRISRKLTDN